MDNWKFEFFLIILCGILKVTLSAHIVNLKVPSTFVIDSSTVDTSLILDCEYEANPEERLKDFVLKWSLNNITVYQWIWGKPPMALGVLRNRIDLNYIASKHPQHTHRALAFRKPHWNLTGEYTCSISTFIESDRRSKFLQMVVPENDFSMMLNQTQGHSNEVNVWCIVDQIYPLPNLEIILSNTDRKLDTRIESTRNDDGLFSTTGYVKIHKNSLESPTSIECVLTISKTDYIKKKGIIYYDAVDDALASQMNSAANGTNKLSLHFMSSATLLIGGFYYFLKYY